MTAIEGRTPQFFARNADIARLAGAIRRRHADRDVAARIDPGVALARRLSGYPVVSNAQVEEHLSRPWAALAAALLAVTAFAPAHTRAEQPTTAAGVVAPAVSNTLRALDRLHSYGYVINTEARADKAIRHWQKVNGLIIDGRVGKQTLHSLDLLATGVPGMKAQAPAPVAPNAAPVPAAGDVEQIIRDVWPDDLEDHAVAIARRESNLQPGVRNACCYGLFQLYFTVLRSHLADWGITSPAQLFDARTNATVAYQLYLIDGWRPWSLG